MNTEGSWDKDSDKNRIKATVFTAELLLAYHYFRGISAISRHTHSVGFLGEVTLFITATFMLSHLYHIINYEYYGFGIPFTQRSVRYSWYDFFFCSVP